MNRSRNLACLGALLIAPAATAADWMLRLEPTSVDAYGHDQHALTIRNRDTTATPASEQAAGHDVEVPRVISTGLGLRRMDGNSGLGLDIFWYGVTADALQRTAAGSAGNEVVFEASDQTYSSTAPGTVLYYTLREDNRLEVWTADFYYARTLTQGVELQAGLRFGDFDNDYRATIGIQGVEGTFIDASSNYPRMMGPVVGLSGAFREQRHRLEGYLGQSVIVGRASLKYSANHFTGTPAAPTIDDRRYFSDFVNVAIPITELRLRYTYELTERWSLGTGASTSAWWNVPVPPGVAPGPNAGQTLQEDTVVFYSILASLEWRF